MIRVFREHCAVDECPLEDYSDCKSWDVDSCGSLTVGREFVNQYAAGFVAEKTYAPGAWRWVQKIPDTEEK